MALNTWMPPPRATGPVNSSSTTTFSYFSDFAYAIGYRGRESSRHFIRKMWIDGALVYDATTGFRERRWVWTFYDGTQDGPDPVMQADPQVGENLKDIRYPGMMYVVLRNVDLSKTGLRPPDVTCEIWASSGQPAGEQFFSTSPAVLNNTRIGVDWNNRVIYGVGQNNSSQRNRLFLFDIDNLNYIGEVPLQVPDGENLNSALQFFYIPWLDVVVQNGLGTASPIYFHNASTGILVYSFGNKAITLKSGPNTIAAWSKAAAVFNPVSGTTHMITVSLVTKKEINLFSHTRDAGWSRVSFTENLIPGDNKIKAVCGDDLNASFYVLTESGNIYRYNPRNGEVTPIYVNTQSRKGREIVYDIQLNIIIAFFEDGPSGTYGNSFVGIQAQAEPRVLYDRVAISSPDFQPNSPSLMLQSNLNAGTLGYGTLFTSNRAIIEISTGQQRQYTQSDNGSFFGPIWDSDRSLFIGTSSGQFVNRIISPFNPDDRVTLGSFLQDICERLGFQRSNVIVTEIQDVIIGAIIVDEESVRSLLKDTCDFFRINMVESGNTIRFTRRDFGDSLTVVATLPLKSMARLQEGEDQAILGSSRIDINDIPGAVTVWYIDREADFTPIPYTASRNSVNTQKESRLNLPFVLEKSQVATLASAMLYDAWAVQLTHGFRLPPRYGYLEPGDVVDIIDGSYSDSVRIIQSVVNGDWSISVSTASVRENEPPTVIVDDTRMRRLDDGLPIGNPASLPIIIDGPLVNITRDSTDDVLNRIVAVPARDQADWPGGLVTYESISVARGLISNFRETVPWGRVIGVLGDGSPCATDYFNILRVRMNEPDFGDVVFDEEASQNLVSLCAVGRPGAWEYMTFSGFSWSDGVGTFTGLVRGRLGTDTMTDKHSNGDVFIMLGDFFADHLVKMSDVGSVAVYSAIGVGEDLLAGNRMSVFLSGNSNRHYEPGDILAKFDGDDIDITWQRRDRLSPSLEGIDNDGPEVIDLSDIEERYRLEIFNTTSGASVRVVEVVGQTSYTYTEAEQISDGYSASSGYIRMRVWQVSSYVGSGFAKERLVNVAL